MTQSSTAEKVIAAQKLLVAEVAKLQSGDEWAQYLQFQARLHDYSARNALLIFTQHSQAWFTGQVPTPYPSAIAGYRTWESLGRHVVKGQHGYTILAPRVYKRREAVDSAGTVRRLGRDEQASPGETEVTKSGLAGFTTATVFDVTQTTGDPLPEPPRPHLLSGEAPAGLGEAVKALIESRGFTVDTVANARAINGANGTTDWGAKTVLVRADMDDAAMVKTLLHEAGHVLLHGPLDPSLPRSQKEVEAESVAFVVAHAHGMPTDEYSFPYVSTWAGENGVLAVLMSQQRIAQAAQTILAASPAEHLAGGRVDRAPARPPQPLAPPVVPTNVNTAVSL